MVDNTLLGNNISTCLLFRCHRFVPEVDQLSADSSSLEKSVETHMIGIHSANKPQHVISSAFVDQQMLRPLLNKC